MATIVPENVTGMGGKGEGLMAFMGYNVRNNGPDDDARGLLLVKIYGEELVYNPGAINEAYILSWGKPKSKKRFYRIADFLSGNSDSNEGEYVTPIHLERWGEDHDLFVGHYGPNHGVRLGE